MQDESPGSDGDLTSDPGAPSRAPLSSSELGVRGGLGYDPEDIGWLGRRATAQGLQTDIRPKPELKSY